MIKVDHLVKRYGSNYALHDISFEIGEGEIVGLLGPNGAGKSTTMNILTGYLSTTSGQAEIGGIDILKAPLEAKKLIGYLPEQPPVYPDMTVEEYLNFVYDLKGCTLPRAAHLKEIAGVVKLTDVKRRLIRNLSKGYRQRVGIAQALIGDPKVVIFDEPTVGLDPKQILEVRNLLRTLGKRHTVILSTHILSEVQAVCERILIINRGEIIADRRTEDLTRAIDENAVYRFSICGPAKEVHGALRELGGVTRVETLTGREGDASVFRVCAAGTTDVRKNVFYLCSRRGWPLIGASAEGDDLESVFIRLVDRADAGAREKERS